MRYFTQAVAEEDAGRKDMLYDIATEELSHLEIIGTIVAMLNRGAKGNWRKRWTSRRSCIASSMAPVTIAM